MRSSVGPEQSLVEAVERSSIDTGYDVTEVRQAADRPGKETVIIARKRWAASCSDHELGNETDHNRLRSVGAGPAVSQEEP